MITTAAYLLGTAYESAHKNPEEKLDSDDMSVIDAFAILAPVCLFIVFDYLTIKQFTSQE